ncbi:MAG: tetratricopeptide repeat protein [Fimbriimonadaceae bacterium]|nr:tetratricopeptide repeat protein [Fimbriimonadaceae bacterium]
MQRAVLVLGLLTLGGCGRPGPPFEALLPPAVQALRLTAERTKNAADWAAVGRAEVARRQWLNAAEAYEEALRRDPRQRAALGELAGLRLHHGERAAAEGLLQRLLAAHPNDAEALAVAGVLQGQLQRPREARATFQRAVALDPEQPVAVLALGQAALAAHDLAAARTALGKLQRRAASWRETRIFELQVAQAGSDSAGFERLLLAAWASDPSPEIRKLLTAHYLQTAQAPQALRLNQQWLTEHPDDLDAKLALALAQQQVGDTKTARHALQSLVDAGTPDPRPYVELARLHFSAGRNDEAEGLLRDALARAETDSTAHLAIADLYAAHDRPSDASVIYQRLVADDPQLAPEVAWRLAALYQEADIAPPERGPDPIEQLYQTTLARLPQHLTALNNLAFHYAHRNQKVDLGRQLIDRALKLRPADPNLIETRAWLRFRAKDYRGALSDLTLAAQALRDDPLWQYHQAAVLSALQRRGEALPLARRALASSKPFPGKRDCEDLLADLEAKP